MFPLLLPLLFSLGGCAALDIGSRGDTDLYQRVLVVATDEGYRFRECHRSQWQTLSQWPGQLDSQFKRLGLKEGESVYAEWISRAEDGDASGDDAEGFSVRQLRLIGGDLSSCQHHLREVQLRASGLDPLWTADIQENHIHVHDYDGLKLVRFPRTAVSRDDGDWVWESEVSLDQERKHRLLLRIRPLACREGDVWIGLSAEMELDGRFFRGCARMGDLDRLILHQQYQLPLETTTRAITLNLSVDGGAEWLEDYLTGQPVMVSRGGWRLLPGGRLLVSLDERDAGLRQEVLSFHHAGNGVLVLQGYHPSYGQGGLTLVPASDPIPWRTGRFRELP
ncbi:hypothetical protein [Nitrincola sp. MINF-07-Sa-05]|uniref:hypothetical protein n=1 Tax=Nitrincola salilacus TaxID=3400273 RepID=UPI003918583C